MDSILYLKVAEMGFVFTGDNADDHRAHEGSTTPECQLSILT